MTWRDSAACAGRTDLDFFPEDGRKSPADHRQRVEDCRAVCRTCPVQAECLAEALAHYEHGVWAGTTPAQRRWMRGGRAEHGTYNTYNNYECRCVECRQGLAERKRQYRAVHRGGEVVHSEVTDISTFRH